MRQTPSNISLLTPPILAAALLTLPLTASAAEPALSLLVPAYFTPDSQDWAAMQRAASQVSITAIINPNSGPGSTYDPAYAAAIDAFHAAGGKVIGYVSTVYSRRGAAEARSEIDRYLDWYHVDGLFFDEMTNFDANGSLKYYENLTEYARTKNNGLSLFANPGTPPTEDFVKLFDNIVLFESPVDEFGNYTAPAYLKNYDARRFSMLVIDGSADQMQRFVSEADERNIGYIYVNDRAVNENEWGALPAYWNNEVAAVLQAQNVPEPDQYLLLAAGLGLVGAISHRRLAAR